MEKLNEIEFEFLDLVLIFAKNKKKLAIIFMVFLVFSYLCIFVLVKPEFVADATIISSGGSNPNSGLMALAGKFSGVLPSLSNDISVEGEFGLYTTIVMSRVSMENVLDRFNLMKKYKFKNRESAVKALRKRIGTDVTMDNAYVISSQFQDPKLASDVTNYLVQYLNAKVIEINVTKSKNDRLFLEKRLEGIKIDLKGAEDSLKAYQEKNGMFEAKSQAVALMERFSKIESEWAKKDLEARVKKELMGEQSNEYKTAKIASLELKKDIDIFKNKRTSDLNMLPLDSLPKSVLGYYRLYRNVEVYAAMLQYIFPVFEQARFNEQKMTPVMNVIDDAVPPIKRAFPQRTITALLIATFMTLCAFLWLVAKEVFKHASNPKLEKIKAELFGTRA